MSGDFEIAAFDVIDDFLEIGKAAVGTGADKSDVDFFTDECVPCKELDALTFSDPSVQKLATQFIPIKLDLTIKGWTSSVEKEEIERLQAHYRIPGVPRILFLRPDGEVMDSLTLTGFENADKFSARMKRALSYFAPPEKVNSP